LQGRKLSLTSFGRPKNFGVSYERGLGEGREAHEGAGGKVDSTQRDMGQTGEVM
jgi:hypothetical protein